MGPVHCFHMTGCDSSVHTCSRDVQRPYTPASNNRYRVLVAFESTLGNPNHCDVRPELRIKMCPESRPVEIEPNIAVYDNRVKLALKFFKKA